MKLADTQLYTAKNNDAIKSLSRAVRGNGPYWPAPFLPGPVASQNETAAWASLGGGFSCPEAGAAMLPQPFPPQLRPGTCRSIPATRGFPPGRKDDSVARRGLPMDERISPGRSGAN